MAPSYIKFAAVAAFALIGVGAAVIRLSVFDNKAAQPATDAVEALEAKPPFSLPPVPDFETEVIEGSERHVAQQIGVQVRNSLRGALKSPLLTPEVQAKLGDAAADHMEPILSGSFDAYLALLEKYDGHLPLLAEATDPAQARKELSWFWDSMTEGWRHHPISLDEIVARPRFLYGKEIPYESDDPHGAADVYSLEQRYPVPRDAETERMTIYEVVVPIFYARENISAPIYLGYWFAWSAEHNEWFPWQIRLYDPTGSGVQPIGPSY